MTTLYPMDFHRRMDRRWAERRNSATADAHGSMAHARSAGRQGNEIRHAREALDRLPGSDAAQGSQHHYY
jgi:hypothetical protein